MRGNEINCGEKDVRSNSSKQINQEDICYSADDILAELKSVEHHAGFSKEIPFRQGPYLDAPFSQFPNFKNGPL